MAWPKNGPAPTISNPPETNPPAAKKKPPGSGGQEMNLSFPAFSPKARRLGYGPQTGRMVLGPSTPRGGPPRERNFRKGSHTLQKLVVEAVGGDKEDGGVWVPRGCPPEAAGISGPGSFLKAGAPGRFAAPQASNSAQLMQGFFQPGLTGCGGFFPLGSNWGFSKLPTFQTFSARPRQDCGPRFKCQEDGPQKTKKKIGYPIN